MKLPGLDLQFTGGSGRRNLASPQPPTRRQRTMSARCVPRREMSWSPATPQATRKHSAQSRRANSKAAGRERRPLCDTGKAVSGSALLAKRGSPSPNIRTRSVGLSPSATRRRVANVTPKAPKRKHLSDATTRLLDSILSELKQRDRTTTPTVSSYNIDKAPRTPRARTPSRLSGSNYNQRESRSPHQLYSRKPPMLSSISQSPTRQKGNYASAVMPSPRHGSPFPPVSTPRRPSVRERGNSANLPVPSHISNLKCTWSAPGQEQSDYGNGGYLRVHRGMRMGTDGRYHLISKLGWGEFSTVWLAYDEQADISEGDCANIQFVAIKISKCGSSVLSSTKDEVTLLKHISKHVPKSQSSQLTTLLDAFEHNGNHGIHICMVLPVLGQNILCLVEQGHRHKISIETASSRGRRTSEDLHFVKQTIRDTLRGLAALNRIHVVHTDLKPENILLSSVSQRVRKEMRAYQDSMTHNGKKWSKWQLVDTSEAGSGSQSAGAPKVKVSDFGLSFLLDPKYSGSNSTFTYSNKIDVNQPGIAVNKNGVTMQTREYRAPEVINGADFTCTTDVWSVGCIAYELVTGNFLMDPKKSLSSNSPPKPEDEINIDHWCMIQQLLSGRVNPSIPKGKYTKRYFHSDGRFRHNSRMAARYNRRNLEAELQKFLPASEVQDFTSFVYTCLGTQNPMERPTAEACLRHPWLQTDACRRL